MTWSMVLGRMRSARLSGIAVLSNVDLSRMTHLLYLTMSILAY